MDITKVIIGKEESYNLQTTDTVEDAINMLHEMRIRKLVVLDGDKFAGFFSLRSIVHELLPKALTLHDEIPDMDFIHGDEGDVIERLDVLKTKVVGDLVKVCDVLVTHETDLTEVLRHLYVHGTPLPVVHKETKNYMGLVTAQSMLEYLQSRM